MNKTKIEWVRNPDGSQGYTWNPITGCLNHVKGMCKGGSFPCYAYRLAYGRLRDRYLANTNVAYKGGFHDLAVSPILLDPFYPRFWPERLLDPPFGKKCGIFVCDMSDLFGIGIPEWWQEKVFKTINMHPQHRFYLLTKHPQNLIKFNPFPDNCWVGVTATSHRMLEDALYNFVGIEARVKFISFEPLLESMNLIKDFPYEWDELNWLIIGAQTRPTVYPRIEHVREIVEAADKAGVPVFLKDNLRSALRFHSSGIWRQEMPA